MKICYVPRNFHPPSLDIIEKADQILNEFSGYVMTLRQVYYRFIALNWFPDSWIDQEYNVKHGLDKMTKNSAKNYSRLGSLLNDARLAGLIDWDQMEDRTRNLRGLRNWNDPKTAVQWLAEQYRIDMWANQPCRVEVWIEKDALLGIFGDVCNRYDVPYFSCRGYTSQSAMWGAAMRMNSYQEAGQVPVILHFGDHDPSGTDMSRDIKDRLEVFGCYPTMKRVALTDKQVRKYKLPPDFAKQTDARFKKYQKQHGDDAWELDALTPPVLSGLVEDAVVAVTNMPQWQKDARRQQRHVNQLKKLAKKMKKSR